MPESLLPAMLRRIQRTGPMTVAEYMAEALHDRAGGYYASGDPFGSTGDFVTAPEVSQMFGELLGLWMISTWIGAGAPERVCLVELGPGRGTLMADMLRAIGGVVDPGEVFQVHLVETNPSLRAIQAERLSPLEPVWHDDISSLPEMPWFLVANEFFDALPIRQLRWTDGAWKECLVVTDEAGTGLSWGVERSESPLAGLLPAEIRGEAAEGAMAELTLPASAITSTIARHIVDHGGAALLIDYGSERGTLGASLQAVRDHRRVNPLIDPGLADLSSHVDFSQLRAASEIGGVTFAGPVDQGRFLFELGIEERASALKQGASLGQCRDIDSAMRRLIGPTEMGTLFKVAALLPPGSPDPAGFGSRIEG
jgi:NADH dehydrogenase [ubiquinone] 1 alpha subcomplex assembly factor 7